MSKIVAQFSRSAHTYNQYNMIQAQVAQALVEQISDETYSTIIDLGCGSGSIYRNIETHSIRYKRFFALDFSEKMLALHPSAQKVYKRCVDFNQRDALDFLSLNEYSLLLSSSALQWSKDLDVTLGSIAQINAEMHFAIFTANTFKTLHETAKISSPIYSAEYLQDMVDKYFDADYMIQAYQLMFPTTQEMFQYIKRSGVSGGERHLTYGQTKALMREYPLEYLEFEVLFVKVRAK